MSKPERREVETALSRKKKEMLQDKKSSSNINIIINNNDTPRSKGDLNEHSLTLFGSEGNQASFSLMAPSASIGATEISPSPRRIHNQKQNEKSISVHQPKSTSDSIDEKTFKIDVKMFETFMNPYSGMLELARLASKHPYLVSKISAHILAQRSKVEEKVYNDTIKYGGGPSSSSTGRSLFFSRSKLPLAHVPELARELKQSAQRAAAEIDSNRSLSLETVNFVTYLQAMHPTVPLIELEKAIMKFCEFPHADSVTKALSALESVPLSITIEALEMFDLLDADGDGFVTKEDFLRVSSSSEGRDAASFMFEKFGLDRVKREEFIPLCIPYLTKAK